MISFLVAFQRHIKVLSGTSHRTKLLSVMSLLTSPRNISSSEHYKTARNMGPNRLEFRPGTPSGPASHSSDGLSNLSSAPSRHLLSSPPSSSNNSRLSLRRSSKYPPKHSSGSTKKKPKGLANMVTNYMVGASNSGRCKRNKHGDMVINRPPHGTINNDGMRWERHRDKDGTITAVAASKKKRKNDKIKSKAASSSSSCSSSGSSTSRSRRSGMC